MKSTTNNYLLIGSVALVFAASGIIYAYSGEVSFQGGEQTVKTKNGKTIHISVEGKQYAANVADGTYKLTNGGSIRVRSGKLIWDAFGAVKRLRTGHSTPGMVDPTG